MLPGDIKLAFTVVPHYYAPRYNADSDITRSVVDADFLPPGEMPNGPA